VPSREKHAGIGHGRTLFLSDSPPLWLTVVVQLLFRRARGESEDSLDYYKGQRKTEDLLDHFS
jgi:hypothetical protein